MFDIITIGSATMDIFFETDLSSAPWDTPLGHALVIPLGEKFTAIRSQITSGGNAINTSITFARQGLRVAVVAKLGCDVPGEMIYSRLRKEGVSNKLIIKDEKNPTSRSAVLLHHGERSIITYQGAGSALSLRDFDFHKMKAMWWYVSLAGDSYKLFPVIAKQSRTMGVKLAVNPTMRHIREGRKQLIANLKYVDFLVLNEGEAAELAGIPFSNENEEKIFQIIDKLAPGICAITRGSNGSTISDGKYLYKAGIFKEKKMEDRTGAGDAYGAGFIAGLIRSKEQCVRLNFDPQKIQYAIRLASANAFSVVVKIGASENALYKKDFDNIAIFKKFKIDVAKFTNE